MKIVPQSVEMLWITPNPEKMIELAGRTCYKSAEKITDESASAFCKMLISRGHDAMIEHASASFRFITDRGISHEIARHRLASYAQESTRYCNYSKDKFGNELTFIEPPGLRGLKRLVWVTAVEHAEELYIDMLEKGCSPQIARSVLPTCLKTEIVMTMNFREARHFIKLRASRAAHPQIQYIARTVLLKLHEHAPSVFEDLMDLISEGVGAC